MKIRPVGAELFDANRQTRQTGLMKLIVTFRHFANTPVKKKTLKMCYFVKYIL